MFFFIFLFDLVQPDSLARAPRILSPTLVIHGTRDEVVHINHGYRICSALAENVLLDPLFIDGAGHNDCEMFPQYLLRLSKLVTIEIPRLRGKNGIEAVNKSPRIVKCELHSSPPEANSALGDDTDLSSSSSHRLSQEFRNNSPTISKHSTHSSRSSRRCISPVVVESLRSILLKRRLLTKHSTVSLTGDTVNIDKTDISMTDSKQVSRSNPIFSSETNLSLVQNTELTISKPVEIVATRDSQLPAEVTQPEWSSNTEACAPVTIESPLNDTKHDIDTQSGTRSITPTNSPDHDDLNQLLLPPPPPPPSVSLLGDCLQSQEILWSLHAAGGRKNLTLPQNFNPHRLLNSDWSKLKTGTLPREFWQFSPSVQKPSAEEEISSGSSNEFQTQISRSTSTITTSSDSSTSVSGSETTVAVLGFVEKAPPTTSNSGMVERFSSTDHIKESNES